MVRTAMIAMVGFVVAVGCAPKDQNVISQAASTHTSLAPAVMQDAELSSYLQALGDRIIAAAKESDSEHYGPKTHFDKSEQNAWMFSKNMQFHFVNSKTLNAFTTGGEHMYVYNELFQQCTSEEELAAVMAHEYGHVYCRHVAQGQKHQMETLIAGAAVGGAAGYAVGGKDNGLSYATAGAGVGAAGGQFFNMGFTRHDEAQADEMGFHFYTLAGWDPRHFGDFFQYMIDKGYDKTPGYMSDHPTLASRVEVAKTRVAELEKKGQIDKFRKPPVASPEQFKQLQARAAQLAKTLPDDTALKNSQQLLQALPRSCVMPVEPTDATEARKALAAKASGKTGG